jgi:hypothetical protein
LTWEIPISVTIVVVEIPKGNVVDVVITTQFRKKLKIKGGKREITKGVIMLFSLVDSHLYSKVC